MGALGSSKAAEEIRFQEHMVGWGRTGRVLSLFVRFGVTEVNVVTECGA